MHVLRKQTTNALATWEVLRFTPPAFRIWQRATRHPIHLLKKDMRDSRNSMVGNGDHGTAPKEGGGNKLRNCTAQALAASTMEPWSAVHQGTNNYHCPSAQRRTRRGLRLTHGTKKHWRVGAVSLVLFPCRIPWRSMVTFVLFPSPTHRCSF